MKSREFDIRNLFEQKENETEENRELQVDETASNECYTTITIIKKENVNINTAQKIIKALGRISEIKTIHLNNGKSIKVSCKLNEWGLNCNKKIQERFRNNVRNKIAELMARAGLEDYILSMHRYESCSSEITDEFYEEIKSL